MKPTRAPITLPFWTPGVFFLSALMLAGLAAALYRIVTGLQVSTNLSNHFPWGIWIAYDVEGRVALSAGGFTMAALAHIFHRHKFEPIVRSAVLTAMLGYTFAVCGLLLDLGRYYNAWHPAMPWMWQGNSVLFEVGMCVMAYLTVLYTEFSPVFFERFVGRVNLPGPLRGLNALIDSLLRLGQRTVGKVMALFIIAGVVLSCMHQSALGSLILVAPYKTNALWYTPVLPLLFLMSAIAVGFPMVVFEQYYAAWAFKRKVPMHLLAPLSRFAVVFLGLYLLAKISDLIIRDAYVGLLTPSTASVMWIVEVTVGVLIPLGMLVSERVRRRPALLFSACCLIIAGIVMNRINVFLIAYRPPYMTEPYIPSVAEVLVSVGLTAGLIFMYRAIVSFFPVYAAEDSEAPAQSAAAPLETAHAK